LIDNNELFLIRHDSIKKSYDFMINKLNRERNLKRPSALPVAELEEQVRGEYHTMKKSFGVTKDIFSEVSNSKRFFSSKQSRIKKKIDNFSKEIKQNALEKVSETDFINFYLFDLMKKKSAPNNRFQDDPLF